MLLSLYKKIKSPKVGCIGNENECNSQAGTDIQKKFLKSPEAQAHGFAMRLQTRFFLFLTQHWSVWARCPHYSYDNQIRTSRVLPSVSIPLVLYLLYFHWPYCLLVNFPGWEKVWIGRAEPCPHMLRFFRKALPFQRQSAGVSYFTIVVMHGCTSGCRTLPPVAQYWEIGFTVQVCRDEAMPCTNTDLFLLGEMLILTRTLACVNLSVSDWKDWDLFRNHRSSQELIF